MKEWIVKIIILFAGILFFTNDILNTSYVKNHIIARALENDWLSKK